VLEAESRQVTHTARDRKGRLAGIARRVRRWLSPGRGRLAALDAEVEAMVSLYEARREPRRRPDAVTCVAFSKDRALQLHALLASYRERASSRAPVIVLYAFSDERHRRAYDELIALCRGEDIDFVRQRSPAHFREQTLGILERIDSGRVFFLVDDDLFIDRVDIADFARADPRSEIASLRLGACLSKCYVAGKEQPLPPWLPSDPLRPGVLRWRWAEGQLEWSYPISLDGHLFDTDEFGAMAAAIPFHSPNSLEGNLQRFKRLFLRRRGVCYANPAIVNVPCNRVQTDFPNRFGGVHQEALLQAWSDGLRMDYAKLFGMRPESVHQEIAFPLVAREQSARAPSSK
jgi:hypothetical protein